MLRNVYIGSMMKSVSAPSPEDVSIWVHLTMGGLTIIASVLVTCYLYKYFKMAVGSEPVPGSLEAPDDDLESHLVAPTPPSTSPPPETSACPPSPLPPRQRIGGTGGTGARGSPIPIGL